MTSTEVSLSSRQEWTSDAGFPCIALQIKSSGSAETLLASTRHCKLMAITWITLAQYPLFPTLRSDKANIDSNPGDIASLLRSNEWIHSLTLLCGAVQCNKKIASSPMSAKKSLFCSSFYSQQPPCYVLHTSVLFGQLCCYISQVIAFFQWRYRSNVMSRCDFSCFSVFQKKQPHPVRKISVYF